MPCIPRLTILGLVFTFAVITIGAGVACDKPRDGVESKHVKPAELNAEELARILGIETFTFEYDGGPLHCWLEIDDRGSKYSEPTRGGDAWSPVYRKITSGRILMWWRPEDFGFNYSGGAGLHHQLSKGDRLWFDWKRRTSKLERIDKVVTPELGDEIVLLRYETVEAGPNAGKTLGRIVLVLKAQFVDVDAAN